MGNLQDPPLKTGDRLFLLPGDKARVVKPSDYCPHPDGSIKRGDKESWLGVGDVITISSSLRDDEQVVTYQHPTVDDYIIPRDCLELYVEESVPNGCICSIDVLMGYGCRCGGV